MLNNFDLNSKKPHTTYMSVPEASKLSGLSEYFIRSRAKSGDIPHIMAGNKFVINYPKMLDYLESIEM